MWASRRRKIELEADFTLTGAPGSSTYQLMDAKKHANRGHEPTTGYKPTGYARKAAAKVAKAKVRAAKKAERAWAIRDQG